MGYDESNTNVDVCSLPDVDLSYNEKVFSAFLMIVKMRRAYWKPEQINKDKALLKEFKATAEALVDVFFED